MRARRRHSITMLATLLLFAGCSDEPAPRPGDAPPRPGAGREDEAVEPVGEDEAPVVPPARAAAIDRAFVGLVDAYADVSGRINFLVAAETLREDAVDSGAGEAVELERTGAVRVELRRLRAVLARTRPKVARARVSDEVQQRVQRLLLQAIDARTRALGQLEFALDGLAAEVGDTVIDERFDAWRTSWDESLGATRAATTSMQDERARVGLEPAPEESFR